VILSQEAAAILGKHLGQHDREWVFPNPDGRPYARAHVSRVFRAITRRLNLKDFHFHDLRHHGPTKALNAGHSAPIVMTLGGWKTERMMRRYAAVTDPLRKAAEAVSSILGQAREEPAKAPNPPDAVTRMVINFLVNGRPPTIPVTAAIWIGMLRAATVRPVAGGGSSADRA